ncbi:MAG: hypothetical protein WD794_14400 [Mycobacteriales bacterium]
MTRSTPDRNPALEPLRVTGAAAMAGRCDVGAVGDSSDRAATL